MKPPEREKHETARLKESRKQGLYADLQEGDDVENGGAAKRPCLESELPATSPAPSAPRRRGAAPSARPAGLPGALLSPWMQRPVSTPLTGEAGDGLAVALEALAAGGGAGALAGLPPGALFPPWMEPTSAPLAAEAAAGLAAAALQERAAGGGGGGGEAGGLPPEMPPRGATPTGGLPRRSTRSSTASRCLGRPGRRLLLTSAGGR